MLLWDIIRDWFVQYIWGGVSSDATWYGGWLGQVVSKDTSQHEVTSISGFFVPINGFNDFDETFEVGYIGLGDWLSTTSTIVVLVILCIIFGLMVRWLFRLTSGLLQGR